MGKLLSFTCEECGYSKTSRFGGTISNHRYFCGYPALDTIQNEIVTYNYFEKTTKPAHIKLFDDPGIIDLRTTKPISKLNSHDVILFYAKYLCPKCNHFSIQFQVVGVID